MPEFNDRGFIRRTGIEKGWTSRIAEYFIGDKCCCICGAMYSLNPAVVCRKYDIASRLLMKLAKSQIVSAVDAPAASTAENT
jgi:hypothetical protein